MHLAGNTNIATLKLGNNKIAAISELQCLVSERRAKTPRERFNVLWGAARELPMFLLNIPARYDFEKSLYEARAEKVLSAAEITELNRNAWSKWYGDALSEMDEMFWAWKLHFYISEVSFYNFPYTFGYLFSLGIFARAKEQGPAFLERYEALLRATGSDTSENVARSVLGVDLREPDFWQESIGLIRHDLNRLREVG